jgi:hypothetical protein
LRRHFRKPVAQITGLDCRKLILDRAGTRLAVAWPASDANLCGIHILEFAFDWGRHPKIRLGACVIPCQQQLDPASQMPVHAKTKRTPRRMPY